MTATQNPTISFPCVSRYEQRWVVGAAHGDTLITYTEYRGDIDTLRMSAEADRDLLIYPTMSDGTEHLVSVLPSEAVRFSARPGDEPGVRVERILRDGSVETFDLGGWVRVIRGRA